MADPYSILGVSKGATEKDVKSAYRKLAKQFHPDRNKDNPAAAEKFSDATRAYDLLSDKDMRARFDRGEIDMDGNQTAPFGYGGGQGSYTRQTRGSSSGDFAGFGGESVDFADIFDGLFGGGTAKPAGGGFGGFNRRSPPPAKGANVAYSLPVEFTAMAKLEPQRITLGDGKTIDLKLPAGCEDGTQMRLSGKGQPGTGGSGDAIVTIKIKPHSFFVREGDHVRLDLPVTLNEAAEGAKVKVPTVEGPVMLTVKAGSSSGQQLRLKGRGFHHKKGGRGDQIVTLMIDLPTDDADLKKRLKGWTDGRNVRADLGV